MKQTAQFKLNQWEKADRIQMEDFNADNNKIENAIAAARTELSVQIQKLRDDLDEITYITKPTHEFNGGGGPNQVLYFPFQILDLTKIRECHFLIWPNVAQPTQLTLKMGSQVVGTLTTGDQAEDVHDVAHMLLVSFYPYFCPKSRVRFTARGLDEDVIMTTKYNYAQTSYFTLSSPGYDLLAGTRFKAYVYH
jgi:hypothetical protein